MTSQTPEDLRLFHEFIGRKLAEDGPEALTPEEALELWRLENPTSEELAANLEAIRQGLDDLKAGRVHPARDTLADMRQKYRIPESP